jgi:hypothetical protein
MIRPNHQKLLETVFNHLKVSQDRAIMIADELWTYRELRDRVLAIESHWVKNKDWGILIVAHWCILSKSQRSKIGICG